MATVERAVLGRGESIFIAALNKKIRWYNKIVLYTASTAIRAPANQNSDNICNDNRRD